MDVLLDNRSDTVRRTLLASCGALLYTFVFLICYGLGYVLISQANMVLLITTFWLGHLAIITFVIYRQKKNLHVASMTLPHMVWAIIFVSITLYYTVEIRSALMMSYLTILPFGAFRLNWRGIFGITLFTLASYATALFFLQQSRPGHWSADLELIIGSTFLLSLLGYSVLGREFSMLRERLTKSNQQLQLALHKIEELVIQDELTGLYNRRHLFDMLDKQRAIANREGTPFVLAFIDLDHFKKINDQYGHAVGDKVLRQFSDLLQESVREIDLVARYGGEEFVLLLNGVGIDTAEQVLERIRTSVERMRVSSEMIALTISVGITEYIALEAGEVTLERADKLLYAAKQSGRNKVVRDNDDATLVMSD